ncbi:MAG: DUF2207 domain-containing protein, partial [Candidatus Eisenbacteria sp.]|nr:DUF2207 domain-containing protein [Candidatus Eisenbacteria bacterium]
MRRFTGTLIAVVLTAAVLVGVSASAGAKSYYFPKITVDVTVRPDGSFEFREARTYAFDGDFTWAFYQVEKVRTAGGNRVDITDFVIGEHGRPFTLGDARSLDESEAPSSYWVSYDYQGDSVYGKWFYRADDETRTFEISYVVHDAVTVYDDNAQLYWKLIGENWDVPAKEVTGTIHLPPGADKDRVRAWLHTELTSEYWIEEDAVRFRVTGLRPGEFVEMRVLFPPELVPGATSRASGDIWDSAFAEESRWVEDANRRRIAAQEYMAGHAARARVAAIVAIALGLAALLVWTVLFVRFGREHDVTFDGDYFRELPSERQPALVGYLMSSGMVGSGDMVGTIMDLARRGYLTIEEVKHEERGFLEKLGGTPEYDYILKMAPNKELLELASYERDLLRFIFSRECAGGTDTISLHEFKKEAQKHATEFHRWFESWKKRVKALAKERGDFEKKGTSMMIVSMIVGGVVMAAGVALAALFQSPFAVIGMVAGGATIPLAALIKRRFPEAALEFKHWKALKRYLQHFSELQEAPPASLTLWEHFLVYAVALGVADKVLKALEPHLPQMEASAGRSF